MSYLSAAQWLVLDNLLHKWPYRTNLDADMAEAAYLWCISNGYVKDGKITASGEGALLAMPVRKGADAGGDQP